MILFTQRCSPQQAMYVDALFCPAGRALNATTTLAREPGEPRSDARGYELVNGMQHGFMIRKYNTSAEVNSVTHCKYWWAQ